MKKKEFDLPFVGYDLGSNNGWNFDVLIGKYGNPIIGFIIKNPVEQYSADPEGYIGYHQLLNNFITLVGEGYIVQKLDIFRKEKYFAEQDEEYLQKKYSKHFEGREFRKIDTLILLTDIVGKKYKFTTKKYHDLINKCQKVFMLLKQNDIECEFMMQKDFEYYLRSVLSMNFSKVPTFNNIKSDSEYLVIGNKHIKTISFVDVENIELPQEISTFSTLGKGNAGETAVDNFTFINDIENFEVIIFNQIISIPEQTIRQRELDKKKKRHEGVAKNAPSNLIIAEEIETLLHNIALDGQLIVDAHFSLCIATNNYDDLEKCESFIENKLFTKGILISKNAYNQLELFRSTLPGNATELKDYDLFTTTSEAALAFFFKESYPVDEDSTFFLRFTDRQGVPLKIDPSDLPMKTGRINNRNKFVLGPSGSGKSFLMNNIVEQYLNYNYDVVIVDTGDSYSGTCKYKGGKYVQYTEEKPITMNPFSVKQEEFNIEKMEFLTNLIFLIWQGADASMTTTQKSVLDNSLLSYYHQYYNSGKEWWQEKSNQELILYLERFNIKEEDIHEEISREYEKGKTYYDLLGVKYDSSEEEIKSKARKLIKEYHPDNNTNNPLFKADKFHKIFEAYETLTNTKRRKEYDKTQLIVAKTREVIIDKDENDEEYNDSFRKTLIKKIKEFDSELSVKELSFNSFYDYCKIFLPIYLNNNSHRINEDEFNVRTFLFVLKDFYKGGRYEKTLNENADNSLFYEPFIVFEIDNVKDNPKLFPIVTLIIMDTFIQKMRLRKDRRKALIIEEAWKAIASKLMGGYILYLYKTVRKFWGEAIVVTQELDDIIGNSVVKDSIINNSDTFLLLDQTKFKDNFDRIASLLSLNTVEQNKIFTINNLNNKEGRSRFKEFYIKRGAKGEVYGNEVAIEQYLTYTTEKPEKTAIETYIYSKEFNGNYQEGLEKFVFDLKNKLGGDLKTMTQLVNLYDEVLDNKVMNLFNHMKKKHSNPIAEIEKEIKKKGISLKEMVL